MGLSGAQRQARWRARRQAELAQLRAAAAHPPPPPPLPPPPDQEARRLQEETRQARAALADLWLAQRRQRRSGDVVIHPDLHRLVTALLHPDRAAAADPALAAYLTRASRQFA